MHYKLCYIITHYNSLRKNWQVPYFSMSVNNGSKSTGYYSDAFVLLVIKCPNTADVTNILLINKHI